MSDNPSTRTFRWTDIAAYVAAAAAVGKVLTAPWTGETPQRFWTLGFILSLVILVVALAHLRRWPAGAKEFYYGLRRPELAKYRPFQRFFVSLCGSFYRALFRCFATPNFLCAIFAAFLAAIPIVVIKVLDVPPEAHPPMMLLWFFSGLFVLTGTAMVFVWQVVNGFKEACASYAIRRELLGVINDWCEGEFNAAVHTRAIVAEDRSNARIMMINAIELIDSSRVSLPNGVALLDEIQSNFPGKNIQILIADPTNKYVVRRCRRLSGKYTEY